MRIAIAGFGLEGKSNLAYFSKRFPEAEITIFDERESLDEPLGNVKKVLGKDAFSKVKDFDLVVRTAGLPLQKISQTKNITSSTKEFFNRCPAPIIGVTGSKGKGTTCGFIASILRQYFASNSERKLHLVGNIGTPALEVLPSISRQDFVVYELSSFQLWDLNKSPQIAVMTLIEPDHLDVHASFAEYVNAKLNIFRYQTPTDEAVFNDQDETVKKLVQPIIAETRAEVKPFMNNKFIHIQQGYFYHGEQRICPTGVVKLLGQHNLQNAAAAISAVWDIIDSDKVAIEKGLASFTGLPHRLQFVGEVQGVKYYDDSIATTPGSVIAAMKSFSQPKILIVGGHDKGGDYHELGKLAENHAVKLVLAIGSNGKKVKQQIEQSSAVKVELLTAKQMSEIVSKASEFACSGDVVILSPAAASFDMFESYSDRGEQFTNAVRAL